MTIVHQRQIIHLLLFLSGYSSQTLLCLSRMPLFFLICLQMVILQILSILNLPIWLDKAIMLIKSNSSRILNLPKVDFTQTEVPQMLGHLSMNSQCTCKGLVQPGMARFPSSSNLLRQFMVQFSLTYMLFFTINTYCF